MIAILVVVVLTLGAAFFVVEDPGDKSGFYHSKEWNAEVSAPPYIHYRCTTNPDHCTCWQDTTVVSCRPSLNGSGDYMIDDATK